MKSEIACMFMRNLPYYKGEISGSHAVQFIVERLTENTRKFMVFV